MPPVSVPPRRGGAALAAIIAAVSLAAPCAAQTDFSRAHSQQFKVSSGALAVSRETLRANLNAASRAAAAGTSQANSNMANVIQNTENYSIVLNGDGNVVNTATGGVKGTQEGSGVDQNADNQINNQSNNPTYHQSPIGLPPPGKRPSAIVLNRDPAAGRR